MPLIGRTSPEKPGSPRSIGPKRGSLVVLSTSVNSSHVTLRQQINRILAVNVNCIFPLDTPYTRTMISQFPRQELLHIRLSGFCEDRVVSAVGLLEVEASYQWSGSGRMLAIFGRASIEVTVVDTRACEINQKTYCDYGAHTSERQIYMIQGKMLTHFDVGS